MVRVALDLMGGDHAPTAVVEGALLAVDRDADLEVALVGPVDLAGELLAERGATGRFRLVAASEVVGMDEDPARAVRSKKDASIRVAHRQVRDGLADAAVSVGSTGAALAASVLTLGRLTPRPALAVLVPAVAGPLVLLDVGASCDATAEQLVQHAVLGAAYAQAQLGLDDPAVALLNVGQEPGKGDQVRKDAHALLTAAPLRFVGNVEGHDVTLGGKADVIVVDGFTGNVLLKGIEGASLRAGAHDLPSSAVLLGVDGVTVVGHGAAQAESVAGCLRAAAAAVRDGLVPRLRTALDRREAVGS
ncbi:MAG: phosphate acyltransferase [Mycobacteriales bacterium]